MSRPWAVWDNDVLTAEWATAEVRNEWSSMKTTYILVEVCFCCSSIKPGIFMDVEVRNWRLSIENGLFVDAVDWIKQRHFCCQQVTDLVHG